MLEHSWLKAAALLVLALSAGAARAQQPRAEYRELEKAVLEELKRGNGPAPGAAVSGR